MDTRLCGNPLCSVPVTGIQGAPFFESPGPNSQRERQQIATVRGVPLETELKYVYDTLRENVAESDKLKGRLQKTQESLVSAFALISSLNSDIFELRKRNAQLTKQLEDKGQRDLNLGEMMEQQRILDLRRVEYYNIIYTKLDEMRKVIMELEHVRNSCSTQKSKASQVQEEREKINSEEGRTPIVARHMNPVVLLQRCVPTEAQLRRADAYYSGSTSSPSQQDTEKGPEFKQGDVSASRTLIKIPSTTPRPGGYMTTRSMSRKRSLRESTQMQSRRR